MTRELLDHHRRMLEVESAISAEVIAERGYYSVETRKELKTAFGSERYTDHLPGLVIPVYNVHGQLAWNHVQFGPRSGTARRCKSLLPLPRGTWHHEDVPRRV